MGGCPQTVVCVTAAAGEEPAGRTGHRRTLRREGGYAVLQSSDLRGPSGCFPLLRDLSRGSPKTLSYLGALSDPGPRTWSRQPRPVIRSCSHPR